MIDIVVTQRIKPGMEKQAEELFREVEAATLANDKGCLRYEWYRAERPSWRSSVCPWLSVPEDGVEDGHELAHASDDGDLGGLSGGAQAMIGQR